MSSGFKHNQISGQTIKVMSNGVDYDVSIDDVFILSVTTANIVSILSWINFQIGKLNKPQGNKIIEGKTFSIAGNDFVFDDVRLQELYNSFNLLD